MESQLQSASRDVSGVPIAHYIPWPRFPVAVPSTVRRSCLDEDGLVLLEEFFDGGDAADGVGNPDGVGLGELVVDEQFADRFHLEIEFGHAPDLAVCQWLPADARGRLVFNHVPACAIIVN